MEKLSRFEAAVREVHDLLRSDTGHMTQALFNMNCAYESLGASVRPSHSIQVVLAYLWSNYYFSSVADQAMLAMLAFGDEWASWREFARVVDSGSLGNPNGIPRLHKLLEHPDQDELRRATILLLLGRELRRSDPGAAIAAYQAVIASAAGGYSPIRAVAERELEQFVTHGPPRYTDDVRDHD